ncbi:PsiF family protein [Aquabacterium sp.]|uniref:PsiF family protein n=1 Tax=Aquabacterium sp. TaxID=1872578 RepID=UPI00248A6DC2|nr:PsiF family protein [Aquabacterium sp.]MDI1257917.1 PsiF family protein [Aquabacterium sp.]
MKVKYLGWSVLLATALQAQAATKEARQDVLRSCAQQSRDQSFSGDAHAEFMRGCLKTPADAKPPVFASSGPQKLAPGHVIQPVMVQPSKTDKQPK